MIGVRVASFGAVLSAGVLVGMGPINPPGPPASTDKTLVEVEPRRPIAQADLPVTITEPGSYMLVENLEAVAGAAVAITVDASNVTIDLSGFSIQANVGQQLLFQRGVQVARLRENVVVRNGTIRGTTVAGIDSSQANGTTVEGVRLLSNGGDGVLLADHGTVVSSVLREGFGNGILGGNGCAVRDTSVSAHANGRGISLGDSAVVERCVSESNDDRGISVGDGSVVSKSTARNNTNWGIVTGRGSSVVGCVASDTRGGTSESGVGIFLGSSSTAESCTARGNAHVGIEASVSGGVAIQGCAASSNGSSGFQVTSGSTVTDSSARSNDFAGFTLGQGVTAERCSASLNADDGFSLGQGAIVRGSISMQNGQSNASAHGFDLSEASSVIDCVAMNNPGNGFDMAVGSKVRGGMAHSNGVHGFDVVDGCVVAESVASENGSHGFNVEANGARVTDNQARSNTQDGFFCPLIGAGFNLFARNSTESDSFSIDPPGNYTGEIQVGIPPSNPLSDDPFVNIDG